VLTSEADVDSFRDPAALLDQIIPEEAQGDEEAVAEIISDLAAAGSAYETLGNTLTEDTDGDGRPDVPEGTNTGAVAQNATVAIAISDLVEQDGGDPTALASASVEGTIEEGRYQDPISDASTEGSALNNILTAGGLDALFD
jgi:hypothetical protein